ncbi:MAG: hypothetical protein U9P14_02490, partial [Gemmatimonadota bacterium]|nr:hypothetical protein [Gemmatimonadota bacterium]
AGSAAAQERLVRVSIQPDNTQWDWQEYASSAAERLATAIESRVMEGLSRREFLRDSSATSLSFRFRVDSQGTIRHFNREAPRYRYLTYLVQSTAGQTYLFDPLPGDFPLFYFDGILTVHCQFEPTGFYKRIYFEEPLDSLENINDIFFLEPVLRPNEPLYLFEPQGLDKKGLLEDFKKRIGVMEQVSDTSSYSPLDFNGRVISVFTAYDSLTVGKSRTTEAEETADTTLAPGDKTEQKTVSLAFQPPAIESIQPGILRQEIISALTEAGAVISPTDYTPRPEPAPASEKPIAEETPAPGEPADSTETAADTTSEKEKIPSRIDSLVMRRDLVAAFKTVFKTKFLVFSLGLAPAVKTDSSGLVTTIIPDTALCRLRLFLSDNPDDLKRNLEVRFAYKYRLPDSLGFALVRRLTDPPPKPKPPPPPEKPAKPEATTPVDSTAAADTLAPVTTPTDSSVLPDPSALPDSSAVPDSTAAADSTTTSDTTARDPGETPGSGGAARLPDGNFAVEKDSTATAADSSAKPALTVDSIKAVIGESALDTTGSAAAGGPPDAVSDSVKAVPDSAGASGNEKK